MRSNGEVAIKWALTALLLLLQGCDGNHGGAVIQLASSGIASFQQASPGNSAESPSQLEATQNSKFNEIHQPAPGVRKILYSCEKSSASKKAPVIWLEQDDGASRTEVWLYADSQLTDIFISLDKPTDAPDACQIIWNMDFDGNFLSIGAISALEVEVGVAGIRRSSAADIANCTSPDQLDALLADRQTLGGEVLLCTVHWRSAGTPDPGFFDLRKKVSATSAPDSVTDLTVRVVDGQYELDWPARLLADYNQDGLVGVSDLTPLGILFGLSQAGDGNIWLVDACARVDGNGDGMINVSDITPIGQNFGNACYEFRVERCAGDAAGPGGSWEKAGTVSRSMVTSTGEAVTSTSRAPYQRFSDEIRPGWEYYRVVALSPNTPEAVPSAAVLALDGTPPAWPGGAGVSGGFGGPESGYVYIFEFNEDAADDRGGEVDYAVQVTGGGDPDEQLLMVEYNDETSVDPVESPFKLGQVLLEDDNYKWLKFVEDEEYYLRIKSSDEAGNCAYSDWYSFLAEYGTADGATFNLDREDLILWVDREGTVRFTPPNGVCLEGLPSKIEVFVRVVPWNDEANPYIASTYDGVEPLAYNGGEVVLERILSPNQKVTLGLGYNSWTGGKSFIFAAAYYPYFWFKPLTERDWLDLAEPDPIAYMSDGTPYSVIYADGSNYLATYGAGTALFYSMNDLPTGAYSQYNNLDFPLQRVPGADTIIFHDDLFKTNPGSVTWFSLTQGVIGHLEEPEGVFTNEIGYSDYIKHWIPEDQDTLLGLRSMVQEADGAQVLELWEARRQGAMSVRELIAPPFELDNTYQAVLLALGDNVIIARLIKWDGFTATEFHYCVVDTEGNWTTRNAVNAIPAVFDNSEWEYSSVDSWDIYIASDLTTWIKVGATSGVELEPEDRQYYRSLYTGNFLDGFEAFMPLFEWRTAIGFGSDYPAGEAWSGGIYRMLLPYDGSVVFHTNDDYYYVLDRHGEVIDRNALDFDTHLNFYKFYPYFTRQGIQGGLANGLLSDDGQWLAVGRQGVLGLAYLND